MKNLINILYCENYNLNDLDNKLYRIGYLL